LSINLSTSASPLRYVSSPRESKAPRDVSAVFITFTLFLLHLAGQPGITARLPSRVEGVRHGQWPASLKSVPRGPASFACDPAPYLECGSRFSERSWSRPGRRSDARSASSRPAQLSVSRPSLRRRPASRGIHLFQVPFHLRELGAVRRVEAQRLLFGHIGRSWVEV